MTLEFTIRVKATDTNGKPQEHLYKADATDRYDAFKEGWTIKQVHIENKQETR